MEYILRIAVHEGNWHRQTEDIIALCRSTPIREIIRIEESHQIMTSAFPMEKHLSMVEV